MILVLFIQSFKVAKPKGQKLQNELKLSTIGSSESKQIKDTQKTAPLKNIKKTSRTFPNLY